MYATQGRYNVRVLKHYYGLNHLHYLTTRTYRRARRFDSEWRVVALSFSSARADLKVGATTSFINLLGSHGLRLSAR
jgi:hypothetical protein